MTDEEKLKLYDICYKSKLGDKSSTEETEFCSK